MWDTRCPMIPRKNTLLSFLLSTSKSKILRIFLSSSVRWKKKNRKWRVARVYIHLAREYDRIKECTRSVYQSGTSRAVKLRPVASSSRFVASLSSVGSDEEDERRRRNEATLWLTIPSCNGQRRGGSATRRQDLFRSTCVRVSIAIYERTLLKFRLIDEIGNEIERSVLYKPFEERNLDMIKRNIRANREIELLRWNKVFNNIIRRFSFHCDGNCRLSVDKIFVCTDLCCKWDNTTRIFLYYDGNCKYYQTIPINQNFWRDRGTKSGSFNFYRISYFTDLGCKWNR